MPLLLSNKQVPDSLEARGKRVNMVFTCLNVAVPFVESVMLVLCDTLALINNREYFEPIYRAYVCSKISVVTL